MSETTGLAARPSFNVAHEQTHLLVDVPREPVRMLRVTDGELRQFVNCYDRSAEAQARYYFYLGVVITTVVTLLSMGVPADLKPDGPRLALIIVISVFGVLAFFQNKTWRRERESANESMKAMGKSVGN